MTREEAKALIIDAAYNEAFVSNCQNKTSDSDYLGHGVVPIHIDKLIKTENDEIKVVIHQKIDQYENFNYRFPVPISNKNKILLLGLHCVIRHTVAELKALIIHAQN